MIRAPRLPSSRRRLLTILAASFCVLTPLLLASVPKPQDPSTEPEKPAAPPTVEKSDPSVPRDTTGGSDLLTAGGSAGFSGSVLGSWGLGTEANSNEAARIVNR